MLQTVQNTGISTVFLSQVLPKLFSQRFGHTASPTTIWDEVISQLRRTVKEVTAFQALTSTSSAMGHCSALHTLHTGERTAQQLHPPHIRVGNTRRTWQILQECGCVRGGIWGGRVRHWCCPKAAAGHQAQPCRL